MNSNTQNQLPNFQTIVDGFVTNTEDVKSHLVFRVGIPIKSRGWRLIDIEVGLKVTPRGTTLTVWVDNRSAATIRLNSVGEYIEDKAKENGTEVQPDPQN